MTATVTPDTCTHEHYTPAWFAVEDWIDERADDLCDVYRRRDVAAAVRLEQQVAAKGVDLLFDLNSDARFACAQAVCRRAAIGDAQRCVGKFQAAGGLDDYIAMKVVGDLVAPETVYTDYKVLCRDHYGRLDWTMGSALEEEYEGGWGNRHNVEMSLGAQLLDDARLDGYEDVDAMLAAYPAAVDAMLAEHSAAADKGAGLDESWQPVELSAALSGAITIVTPTLLRCTDGQCLLYSSRVNGIHGDSGIGKSWIAAIAAAQEIMAGHHVGWIDLEDPNAMTLIERLRLLGVPDSAIAERLHYYSPHDAFTPAAMRRLVLAAIADAWTLCVIDSVGEAFALEGINEDKDNEVAPWLRQVPRTIADAGPGVLLLDHGTKAKDNDLYPSGSKRKRAAITGASYVVRPIKTFTREAGGRVKLVCAKDRHGHFRQGADSATVDMMIDFDGTPMVEVWPPYSAVAPTTGHAAAIDPVRDLARLVVEASKNAGRLMTKNELMKAVKDMKPAADTRIRDAIAYATADGAIDTNKGVRGSILHEYVRDLTESPSS